MEEDIVLAVFAALPVITGLLVYLYFRKISPHLNKAQWLRLIIGNILVFVFLCSPILLFGEIYYRFLYDTTDSAGLTKVCLHWYDRHWRLNNVDVRDSIDYMKKLSGRQRITFIGDSFTAGHGVANVENRFANIIRAKRPDLEIHVFAREGWDTYAHKGILLKLTRTGCELNHVILVYNMNDIGDLMERWHAMSARIYGLKPGFLFEHSYFLNLLYYRLYVARDPDFADYYKFMADAYNGPLWEKQKTNLSWFKSFLDSKHVDFMVVTFPFLDNIRKSENYRQIHRKLDAFWSSIGVPNLDLLSVYEPYPTEDLVVNSHDAHPNEKAHALAAEAIIKFINERIPTH